MFAQTATRRALVSVLLADPDRQHWGYDLATKININGAKVSGASIYSMLQRMTDEGWLKVTHEKKIPAGETRPPRHYYTITPKGRTEMMEYLARGQQRHRQPTTSDVVSVQPEGSEPG